jgi:cytochrome P450
MSLPPGSSLPATAQTYLLIKHFCDFSTFLHMRYGDIFTIRLLGIGPSVHVARPDLIRELFIASHRCRACRRLQHGDRAAGGQDLGGAGRR